MSEESHSLPVCFQEAERKRKAIESAYDSREPNYQDNLIVGIEQYEKCMKMVAEISLFSPNETLDDVSSGNIQYFLVPYYLADLVMRVTKHDRRGVLERGRQFIEQFLDSISSYDVLSREDARTYDRYREDPNSFAVASTTDAHLRREAKISRYKEEKVLRDKIDHIQKDPTAIQNNDSALRELNLTLLKLRTHQSFQSLESIAQELQILSMADASPAQETSRLPDDRARNRNTTTNYSDRLDPPLSSLINNSNSGPILNQDGRPLRPFTLLDNRQRLQQGVFRPDHNLPTMTIDEYLAEERSRGGIIDGGGPQSMIQPVPNEDDLDVADQETMKARKWDDFKDENPKGAGNTMNMG